MKKDMRIKVETYDVPIPMPEDLKGVLHDLAEYFDEDFEYFVI